MMGMDDGEKGEATHGEDGDRRQWGGAIQMCKVVWGEEDVKTDRGKVIVSQ
jgi:hypothetical protein